MASSFFNASTTFIRIIHTLLVGIFNHSILNNISAKESNKVTNNFLVYALCILIGLLSVVINYLDRLDEVSSGLGMSIIDSEKSISLILSGFLETNYPLQCRGVEDENKVEFLFCTIVNR